MATGSESGVFVLDVDGEAGRASLAALITKHGPLPATLELKTGRVDGGKQFWYVWPSGYPIRNSTGKLGVGLDIRGDGGYCLIPPSVHRSGRNYAWANPQYPVADAPTWLLEMASAPAPHPPRAPAAEIGILTEGRRNDGLTRLAGALRRKGLSQEQIETELFESNIRRCRPPLPDPEIRDIAASVARYAPGGPDPLESAWEIVQQETYSSHYEQLLALARQLQLARPNLPIVLPLKRIASLMGLHWTTVSEHRKRAVSVGALEPASGYVPHRRAGEYRVPLTREVPLTTLTTLTSNNHGLVRVPGERALVRTPGAPLVRGSAPVQDFSGEATHDRVEPIILPTPCTCSEKPYPHFRHRDGGGPGSGRNLKPENPAEAHRRRH
jgi:hypothetical protein